MSTATYGPHEVAYVPRAAILADPEQRHADTLIERPDQFEQVVKLQTAEALQSTIPPFVLLCGDEVIE